MRAALLGAALAGAALLVASAARAQAPPADPSEVTNLRLSKVAGDVRLTWTAPRDPADTYQVRRCILPSLRVPFYGNCVAEGLVDESWQEPVPQGPTAFYVVTGVTGGIEGSHGKSFNGRQWRERFTPECALREQPGPYDVAIRLDAAIEFCGIAVRLRYPGELVTFTGAACTVLAESFLGESNDDGDSVRHSCAWGQLDGPSGPGFVVRVDFTRGECPLTPAEFELLTCEIADCDVQRTIPVPCSLW